MNRKLTLRKVSEIYWDYHVDEHPSSGGFIVTNPSLPDMPGDIAVHLPESFELDGIGRPLEPATIFTDRLGFLSDYLNLGAGVTKTTLVFGRFFPSDDERDHTFRPTDPQKATHIWVRYTWDLSRDARPVTPADSVPGSVYRFSYANPRMCFGANSVIIEVVPALQDLISGYQEQLQSVRDWSSKQMGEFLQHRDEVAEQFRALIPRAERVGWKLNFDCDEPDSVAISMRDPDYIHTSTYRLSFPDYSTFLRKLERAETFTSRKIITIAP